MFLTETNIIAIPNCDVCTLQTKCNSLSPGASVVHINILQSDNSSIRNGKEFYTYLIMVFILYKYYIYGITRHKYVGCT